nr:TrkH family potassium uptake protein [Prevotella sp.]
MINFKLIYKIIGRLLFTEAFMMFCCLVMSLMYQEDDLLAFLSSTIITVLCGFILMIMGKDAGKFLSRHDAYFVVTLAWAVFSLMGTLPFIISGYIPNFTDAYFETMSGFTTTGATIINNVDIFPHALLFWRSLTQWVGGLGIVFFTIALLPSLVGGSVKVFSAEATGPIKTKLQPRLSTGAKWIWMVYFILTVISSVCFYFGGMNLFDCVNHAMATTATGGFSTHTASMSYFHSPTLEYLGAIFMFLSGINFTLFYFSIFKGKVMSLFKNSEFKFYLFIFCVFTLFITFELVRYNNYDLEHAFRSSLFQVATFLTSTGLVSDDAAAWPHITWVVLAICMFVGACSGSTSGGFKCVRCVMVLKIIKNEFRQILHPNAILPMKIDGVNVPNQKRVTLLAFLAIYLILILFNSFAMIIMGINPTDAITITLSSLGNSGPAIGSSIGPTMSWSCLPTIVKWMCSCMMLIGRLEIFTVLIIFSPSFWKRD